jgi:hypothetical protein
MITVTAIVSSLEACLNPCGLKNKYSDTKKDHNQSGLPDYSWYDMPKRAKIYKKTSKCT